MSLLTELLPEVFFRQSGDIGMALLASWFPAFFDPKNPSSTTDKHAWTRIPKACESRGLPPAGEGYSRFSIGVHCCSSVVYNFPAVF